MTPNGVGAMAGDWLKMRLDLDRDPAVLLIAHALQTDELHVIGMLWKAWSWANEQTTDGHAPKWTKCGLDRYVRRDGFAEAMLAAGWLAISGDGICFPKFDAHNSDSAKRRAIDAKRKSAKRHGRERTQCGPREEKRREDSSLAAPPRREDFSSKTRTETIQPMPNGHVGIEEDTHRAMFDTLAQVTASDKAVSAGHIARVATALRSAEPPYLPADVITLSLILEGRGFTVPLTLGTVEKYIGLVRQTAAVQETAQQIAQVARQATEEKIAAQRAKTAAELAQRAPTALIRESLTRARKD